MSITTHRKQQLLLSPSRGQEDTNNHRALLQLLTIMHSTIAKMASAGGGPSRHDLLILYKKILRSAATFPSVRRKNIYQAIREEWRDNAALQDSDKIRTQIGVAYKGLEQLRQFDIMNMTGGNPDSPNWDVHMEENPFPKPADYDDRKKNRTR